MAEYRSVESEDLIDAQLMSQSRSPDSRAPVADQVEALFTVLKYIGEQLEVISSTLEEWLRDERKYRK